MAKLIDGLLYIKGPKSSGHRNSQAQSHVPNRVELSVVEHALVMYEEVDDLKDLDDDDGGA